MPTNSMNTSGSPQRRMNIDDSSRGSVLPHDGGDDMEEAQRRLEELRRQKEELDASKRRMEEYAIKKARFAESQNELGERMFIAAERIDQELESMKQEMIELEQIRLSFSKNLKSLGSIRSNEWNQDNLDMQMSRGVELMEHCESDFADAIEHCSHMKHCKVLSRSARRSRKFLLTSREFTTQFLQGLSFHLPLCLILIIIYLIVSCGSSTPKL